MSIWTYADAAKYMSPTIFWHRHCVFCGSALKELPFRFGRCSSTDPGFYQQGGCWHAPLTSYADSGKTVSVCEVCGWWKICKTVTWKMRL